MKYRTKKACLDCGKPFYGNTDKLYCDECAKKRKSNVMRIRVCRMEVLELFIVRIVELYEPKKHKKDLGKEKQLKGSLGVSISASYAAMNIL